MPDTLLTSRSLNAARLLRPWTLASRAYGSRPCLLFHLDDAADEEAHRRAVSWGGILGAIGALKAARGVKERGRPGEDGAAVRRAIGIISEALMMASYDSVRCLVKMRAHVSLDGDAIQVVS